MDDEFVVNGLPLPPLLIALLKQDKWQHPGDKVMREVIPFLPDPVVFMEVDWMRRESSGFLKFADDEYYSEFFHEVRGSKSTTPLELPWLDAEKAVMIAVCAEIGMDTCIALDYRTSTDDPRVVASDWLQKTHIWREATSTFSEFVERIGIKLT